jgi:cellulose biosynthesis protein BcsQ
MNPQELLDKLEPARTRIEAALSGPAVISVTSARPVDGKSLVAASLASNLAHVGHSVLLVDANPSPAATTARSAPKLSPSPEYDVLTYASTGAPGSPTILSMGGPGVVASSSRRLVASAFERFRRNFAYTIVDAPAIEKNAMGLSLVGESDAVIVAFQLGRAATDEDNELVRLLDASGTFKLGVVMLELKYIRGVGVDQLLGLRVPVLPARTRSEEPATRAALGVRVGSQ